MESEIDPRRAFVTQVVTIVHTCHSHNISASRKRMAAAAQLFLSNCRFDGLFDALIRESCDSICDKLEELRFADPHDEAAVTRIKSDCLITARRLHDIAKRSAMETNSSRPADQEDIEAAARRGEIRKTG